MSAWGKSWGLAFGAAFGLVVTTPAPVQESTYYGSGQQVESRHHVHDKYEAIRKAQEIKRQERPQPNALDEAVKHQLAKESEKAERKRLIAEAKAIKKAQAKAEADERKRIKAEESRLASELKQRLAAEAKEVARLAREAKAEAKREKKLAQDQLGKEIAARQAAFNQERIAKAKQEAEAKAQALADAVARAREEARLAALPKLPPIELPTGAVAQARRNQAADEEQIMALMAMMMLED